MTEVLEGCGLSLAECNKIWGGGQIPKLTVSLNSRVVSWDSLFLKLRWKSQTFLAIPYCPKPTMPQRFSKVRVRKCNEVFQLWLAESGHSNRCASQKLCTENPSVFSAPKLLTGMEKFPRGLRERRTVFWQLFCTNSLLICSSSPVRL